MHLAKIATILSFKHHHPNSSALTTHRPTMTSRISSPSFIAIFIPTVEVEPSTTSQSGFILRIGLRPDDYTRDSVNSELRKDFGRLLNQEVETVWRESGLYDLGADSELWQIGNVARVGVMSVCSAVDRVLSKLGVSNPSSKRVFLSAASAIDSQIYQSVKSSDVRVFPAAGDSATSREWTGMLSELPLPVPRPPGRRHFSNHWVGP